MLQSASDDAWKGRRMVLDGITLYNLNIVPPSEVRRRRMAECMDQGEGKFSLYNTINKCITSFGESPSFLRGRDSSRLENT
jgi:DNA mismatch repair ATPase MutS